MIIQAVPELRIQFDPALGLLRSAWMPGAPAAQYRAACTQLLDVSEQYQAQRYLIDMSEVPDISVYDQLWLGRHWVPRALQLPVERVVYCNQASRVHNQLAIESLLYLTRPFITCDVQFFSKPAAALAWLSDYSPRQAEVLAEWARHYGPPPGPGPDELAEPGAPYYPQHRS